MSTRLRARMATFGWWQWLLTAVLLVALVSAGLFAVRTAQYAMYWSQHRNEPIEAWMTLRYVARSYGVPDEALREAIGEVVRGGEKGGRPPLRVDRRPLSRIAEERGQSFEELRTTIEAAIAEIRSRAPASKGADAPSKAPTPTPPAGGPRGTP